MAPACVLATAIEWLFDRLGRSAPISAYRLRSAYAPLVFDCRKAREELGWRPCAGSRASLAEYFIRGLSTTGSATSR